MSYNNYRSDNNSLFNNKYSNQNKQCYSSFGLLSQSSLSNRNTHSTANSSILGGSSSQGIYENNYPSYNNYNRNNFYTQESNFEYQPQSMRLNRSINTTNDAFANSINNSSCNQFNYKHVNNFNNNSQCTPKSPISQRQYSNIQNNRFPLIGMNSYNNVYGSQITSQMSNSDNPFNRNDCINDDRNINNFNMNSQVVKNKSILNRDVNNSFNNANTNNIKGFKQLYNNNDKSNSYSNNFIDDIDSFQENNNSIVQNNSNINNQTSSKSSSLTIRPQQEILPESINYITTKNSNNDVYNMNTNLISQDQVQCYFNNNKEEIANTIKNDIIETMTYKNQKIQEEEKAKATSQNKEFISELKGLFDRTISSLRMNFYPLFPKQLATNTTVLNNISDLNKNNSSIHNDSFIKNSFLTQITRIEDLVNNILSINNSNRECYNDNIKFLSSLILDFSKITEIKDQINQVITVINDYNRNSNTNCNSNELTNIINHKEQLLSNFLFDIEMKINKISEFNNNLYNDSIKNKLKDISINRQIDFTLLSSISPAIKHLKNIIGNKNKKNNDVSGLSDISGICNVQEDNNNKEQHFNTNMNKDNMFNNNYNKKKQKLRNKNIIIKKPNINNNFSIINQISLNPFDLLFNKDNAYYNKQAVNNCTYNTNTNTYTYNRNCSNSNNSNQNNKQIRKSILDSDSDSD